MIAWKPIPGFSAYEISTDAQVRRSIINTPKKVGHRKRPGVLLKPYGKYRTYILVNDHGMLKNVRTNRLMLISFVEEPPFKGAEALHYDDDQSNNNIGNLRWGTQADNRQDAIRNLRTATGERNGSSKLTETDVKHMRELYNKGDIGLQQIADSFRVTVATAHYAITGETWSHIQGAIRPKGRKGPVKPLKGSKAGTAKLTESEVAQIKKLLPTTKGVILAKMFNISVHTISCIKRNKAWKHVEEGGTK